MLKVLMWQKIVHNLGSVKFIGVFDDLMVPDRFYRQAIVNGDEVEGYGVKLEPVYDIPGIEEWLQRNPHEEVEVCATGYLWEEHLPKGVRWFVELKPEYRIPQ